MSKPQTIFKRYEKKYLLSRGQYDALRPLLQEKMTQDAYGEHTICNLYFDTPEYDLIRTSIEKPVYKEKLRLRSYGVPAANDQVFLELKKKYKGIVYKRRVDLSLQEAADYLRYGKRPLSDSHVFNEIDWFQSMYHATPKVFIAYERSAWHGNEDANLRVTFDQGIRFRETALDLASGDWGQALLEDDRVLMEIKIPGAMPLWMSRMLSELKIYPASFSKYGVCYKAYLLGERLAGRAEVAKPAAFRQDYHYAKQGGGLSA
ncbi:polyphosphate polymerase domain-containing protein [Acidaminobacter hydrogenoformans]|uniref:VTC domain-containing protein n=1 Tax=Acidaminobacter hydrogenoformans DSM 2784 TaxID=1120920 RepID=A0A1G5RY38_9FIRM|nr:polyphosphate polymerase domain-containing protein [Acidaminobacter hydrogenoformans]SCZ78758.1 VTC domain-containing protein [Acidaminobacter hydrogenoformans DSM 2784]